jgi:FtsP/CotA-like multicopper oxidase with cupredoxin domain
MHLLKYRPSKIALTALRNRQELIKAGLGRRDLFKMGLLTSAGYLVAKHGLSTRAAYADDDNCISPPTRAFVELLPTARDGTMPIQTPVVLSPAPTAAPNTAAGEGRTIDHQAFTQFPPQKFYGVTQKAGQVSVSPDLPLQTLWGFAVGTPEMNRPITSPGPLYVARYGEPILVRNFNRLPPAGQNGGFGLPSVTTHLHNGHTPSESDGNPCDFFEIGQFYDQHYPNVLAGILSDHRPNGDINEAMSTLWYHDHRVDFTAQNVYKGLAGFYTLFNEFDTGDENTGFHLPSFPNFDIHMMFADKCFDQRTGLLFFDLFNLDGILGDKFLVNGKIQPVLHVSPRRYRFRWLDAGPSRFYQFFLTDLNNLSAHNKFWQISSDGNLLPKPFQVESVRLSVAERADVIIDFAPFAGKTIYIENRLKQDDGRGPTDHVIRPAGQGNLVLKIIVDGPNVADHSQDPATITKFYDLPSTNATPRVKRTFKFQNSGGGWQINGQFFDCDRSRFTVQENSVEQWTLINDGGGWEHPIHIHFEEFQTLSINGKAPATSPLVQIGRKDVLRLEADATAVLFFRFRDFFGKYPMHCHNTVHEDHAMMLRFDIAGIGDTNSVV